MPRYAWKGIDQYGNEVKGTYETTTQIALKEHLFGQKIALLDYSEKRAFFEIRFRQPLYIRLNVISEFFEQLSFLVNNGVELVDALKSIKSLSKISALRYVIDDIIKTLEHGSSFYTALKSHPKFFSPFIVSIIAAGERTGSLGSSLENIQAHLKKTSLIQQEIAQAAQGPLITLCIATVLVAIIIAFIVPQFNTLYQSLGKELPKATKTLITIHSFFTSFYVLLLPVIGAMIIALVHVMQKNTKIKEFVHKSFMYIPVINTLIIKKNTVLCIQTFRLFVSSGLPITHALEHLIATSKNIRLKNDLSASLTLITQGFSLHNALRQIHSPFFESELLALIRVGEQSGKLEQALNSAEDHFRSNLSAQLKQITMLVGPIMMILIGMFIAGLMVVIYLPIFNLGTTLQ